MSRHRVDYGDELDYDKYEEEEEEEEELSPEDKAQMKQGTADVRAALSIQASKVTDAQIQEALWHYYYDVDKTVAYLITKFIDPPKKAPPKAAEKPTSELPLPPFKLGPLSASANPIICVLDLEELSLGHPSTQEHSSSLTPWQATRFSFPPASSQDDIKELFRDMPWGNIPQHRVAILTPPSRRPGGLLGGSGALKGSKLQQLAAARRKKAEESNAQGSVGQTRTETSTPSAGETSREKENTSLAGAFGKRLKISETAAEGRNPLVQQEPNRQEPAQQPLEDITNGRQVLGDAAAPLSLEKAPASGFASTLFEDSPRTAKRNQLEFFTLPYTDIAPTAIDVFSKPSPDDVVLAAQAKAGKKAAAAANQKQKNASAANSVAGKLNELKIDDISKPASKNLDVISEFNKSDNKRAASFVVVGHVDAGKSTMMGRLLLDLGVVSKHTVDRLRQEAEKIGKSSFHLAWVLDQRTEERARGVTIDIATNRFETDKAIFTILDAPGHRDFIPNMIAGVSQADFGLLVIDAGTGAFESGLKGQTREHALLLRSMGVSRVVVAINKLDTVGWNQERFDEIRNQISGFLTGTGFQAKNIAFVPVSGLHGDNLVKKSSDAAASWYSGPTLVEELENSEPEARALEKPLRMSVGEIFRTPGASTSVSGRLDAGSLQTGDTLLVQPGGGEAYIKSVEVNGEPADWAVAGQTVVLGLNLADQVELRVGDILCDPAQPIQCHDTFILKALAFDVLMPMQVDVHRGRLHAEGRIESLTAILDKMTGAVTKKKPRIVKPGTAARVVIKLGSKVPLEVGQRVVLRSGGETVAAGLLE